MLLSLQPIKQVDAEALNARISSKIHAILGSPELGVETWEFNTFVDPFADHPPMIMPLADVHCQLCRGTVTHTDPKMWITATMDRFPTSLNAYGLGDITEDSEI
ncbi:hypothetical protein B0H13DRAFT_2323189 [Mycena leptocephala]|nr:hypothetical protein B0H13DRAFT_2323189 [Mycena leptocephala]